jgi:hypothetical protein
MKYLVTALPGTTTLKIKYGARLFQATKEWVDALLADGTFDCHYGFSDLGALSIVNADSHKELLDKNLECRCIHTLTGRSKPFAIGSTFTI